jgi:hypothetical protein
VVVFACSTVPLYWMATVDPRDFDAIWLADSRLFHSWSRLGAVPIFVLPRNGFLKAIVIAWIFAGGVIRNRSVVFTHECSWRMLDLAALIFPVRGRVLRFVSLSAYTPVRHIHSITDWISFKFGFRQMSFNGETGESVVWKLPRYPKRLIVEDIDVCVTELNSSARTILVLELSSLFPEGQQVMVEQLNSILEEFTVLYKRHVNPEWRNTEITLPRRWLEIDSSEAAESLFARVSLVIGCSSLVLTRANPSISLIELAANSGLLCSRTKYREFLGSHQRCQILFPDTFTSLQAMVRELL